MIITDCICQAFSGFPSERFWVPLYFLLASEASTWENEQAHHMALELRLISPLSSIPRVEVLNLSQVELGMQLVLHPEGSLLLYGRHMVKVE